VPLYNIHKTYAGLKDAWVYTQNAEAKNMLVKMTDWMIDLTSGLSDEQMQDMLRSEHGGLNESFADVYEITGNKKYLQLARRFSHHAILDPLLKREDRLTGLHANTQIPKAIGYKRIADLEGNQEWSDAAKFFWDIVVKNRSVSIGGNSTGEHFNPTDNFSRMMRSIEGPETCNTYNMLRLTKMFFETSGDMNLMDYYERALYNHILSTQHPETGGLVYFTQMRPGHYRVYSQPHTSMWCCVGSGIENHSKYSEMIYSHKGDELYVNLIIPSILTWNEKRIEIIQENSFPDEPKTTFTVNPRRNTRFTMKLRYPSWVKENSLKVSVNGQNIPVQRSSDGFVTISRQWRRGDKVVMEMPMTVRVEQMPDKSNYYTYFYGPVALSAKTGTDDLRSLFSDDSRMGHVAHGRQIPMKDMPIVVGTPESLATHVTPVAGKPLTFKLTNTYPEEKWRDLELVPFFRVHESRYMIYWPQATQAELAEIKNRLEQDEKESLQLNNITIDRVTCGQQQPESDHFIQFESSTTGFIDDIHWREARRFFSYELKNSEHNANYLYISYFDRDRRRNFDVLINDRLIHTFNLTGEKEDNVVAAIFEIPEELRQQETLTVRFAAHPQSATGKITEVRILRDKISTQNMAQ
jgi:DUF1680 family protein